MKDIAILPISPAGLPIAHTLARELPGSEIFSISSVGMFIKENFVRYDAFVFIGALGICIRSIAPCIKNKYKDPAVVNIDSTGKFIIPVLSGHVGGANDLARHIASITGGTAVITTQSDNTGLWALDTMAGTWGWKESHNTAGLNEAVFRFVNGRPTALLLEIKDRGTRHLEQTRPPHVDIFYHWEDIPQDKYDLILAVTPYIYSIEKPLVLYAPSVVHIGTGCRKNCSPEGIPEYIEKTLRENHLNPDSIGSISTIELKKDERLMEKLRERFPDADLNIYTPEELEGISIPNPSEKVFETTGVYGVAETCARKSAGGGPLLIEKQKGALSPGNEFTFAAALQRDALRGGHIEIVGAGPGDPDLISVKGRQMLKEADLILYAGSLVPRELTFCAKEGAVVRSSASMTLEEQFALMKEFYDKGLLTVRLHTGDPCIYGAIQEQMAFFDRYGMEYHITPGISSFQAAAAELRSQFTIPEKVQSIILTRGEGRTPVPEKEKLHLLARSQSTMCIFLSAGVAEQVQTELLEHYPPETPVAACYKLTWKDQRIYRGELRNLAAIIKENNLTLTTLIVVGEAIGNRQGLSRLYSHEFKHLFRP